MLHLYKKVVPAIMISSVAVYRFVKGMINKTATFFSVSWWRLTTYATRKKLGLLRIKIYENLTFDHLSTSELMSIAKHEAHRIEKAHYSGYMKTRKCKSYDISYGHVCEILVLLESRGVDMESADIRWLKKVTDYFHRMDEFLEEGKGELPRFDPEKFVEFEQKAKQRRSTRTWGESSFSKAELEEIGRSLIECARWAPCSGNRQPWFFKLLIEPEEKILLRGIKEEHCVSAPLVIFVGVRKSSYGAIGTNEQGMYVDGGAVSMQMVMAAHAAGLGSCWNHFCKDFVYSRPKNLPIFKNFYEKTGIPEDIEPIALIAFGNPAFVSPPPQRPPFEALCPRGEQG
ncbi:nitroreductase family protein [Kiritimatiellota bacterium B12222]|nr:nitroreductase family protein [Kiritimatiellota bacterium B12222]